VLYGRGFDVKMELLTLIMYYDIIKPLFLFLKGANP